MGRPPGFEPYSLFWGVNWKIWLPAGNMYPDDNDPNRIGLFPYPVAEAFGDEEGAQARLDEVQGLEGDFAPFVIVRASSFMRGPFRYFNRKQTIERFAYSSF